MSRTALVTGGARGIGAAIVGRLLADGQTVISADQPGAGRPEPQANRIDLELDVACPASRAAALGFVERHGTLDVLVNNAGVFRRTPLAGQVEDEEARILAVNADAPAAMTALLALLLQAGTDSAVVNIASVRGLTASADACAYSVSKAAVIDLTRRQARLLAPRIRVNAVAPGDISTGMAPTDPNIVAGLLARIPLGRFGRTDEVAAVVAILASVRARAVNGAVLPVDGGFLSS